MSSVEETLYVFPDHRAIYEIKIFGGRHHFITFIECDRDSETSEPQDQSLIEVKLAASFRKSKSPDSRSTRTRRAKPGT